MHEDVRRAREALDDGQDAWVRLTPEVVDDLGEDHADRLLRALDSFESLDNGAGAAAAEWLRTKALAMHGSTVTYLWLVGRKVEGFYSLCSSNVRLSSGHRKRVFKETGLSVLEIPSLQPASLVAWIAKQADASSDCGRAVLFHAFSVATEVSHLQGSIALVLDPFDDQTAEMWERRTDVPFHRSARSPGDDEQKPRRLWTPLIPPYPGVG